MREIQTLTEESVFFSQSVSRVQQSLRTRRRFAEQTDLAKKLADLRVVPRAHRRVRPRRITDIDSEMLHRRLHHRRQTISSPFTGKQRVAARPKTRALQISGSKRFYDLRANPG